MSFLTIDQRKTVKSYLNYIYYLFSKKIFLFGVAVYLAEVVSLKSVLAFLLFCFNYVSVYFGNDFIDRRSDCRREFILNYKLQIPENYLLYLCIAHLTLPFIALLVIDFKLAVASLLISTFAILRSYLRKPAIREITLFVLQIMQLFIMFEMLGATKVFFEYFYLLVSFSLLYTAAYYFQKSVEKGESLQKTVVYFVAIVFTNVLAFIEVDDMLLLLYDVFSIPFFVYLRKLWIQRVSENSTYCRLTSAKHLLLLAGGIVLIILGVFHVKFAHSLVVHFRNKLLFSA